MARKTIRRNRRNITDRIMTAIGWAMVTGCVAAIVTAAAISATIN